MISQTFLQDQCCHFYQTVLFNIRLTVNIESYECQTELLLNICFDPCQIVYVIKPASQF